VGHTPAITRGSALATLPDARLSSPLSSLTSPIPSALRGSTGGLQPAPAPQTSVVFLPEATHLGTEDVAWRGGSARAHLPLLSGGGVRWVWAFFPAPLCRHQCSAPGNVFYTRKGSAPGRALLRFRLPVVHPLGFGGFFFVFCCFYILTRECKKRNPKALTRTAEISGVYRPHHCGGFYICSLKVSLLKQPCRVRVRWDLAEPGTGRYQPRGTITPALVAPLPPARAVCVLTPR